MFGVGAAAVVEAVERAPKISANIFLLGELLVELVSCSLIELVDEGLLLALVSEGSRWVGDPASEWVTDRQTPR